MNRIIKVTIILKSDDEFEEIAKDIEQEITCMWHSWESISIEEET